MTKKIKTCEGKLPSLMGAGYHPIKLRGRSIHYEKRWCSIHSYSLFPGLSHIYSICRASYVACRRSSMVLLLRWLLLQGEIRPRHFKTNWGINKVSWGLQGKPTFTVCAWPIFFTLIFSKASPRFARLLLEEIFYIYALEFIFATRLPTPCIVFIIRTDTHFQK